MRLELHARSWEMQPYDIRWHYLTRLEEMILDLKSAQHFLKRRWAGKMFFSCSLKSVAGC